MAEKRILKVDGMSCNHCKMRVEKALKSLDGVHEAVVDLAQGTAEVEYDAAKVSLGALITAVADAGYTAQ
ncbi:MAG TPA: heavy-metal-associated domain-containing protein [Firmicutes bacterium]|nr:heavy-metal-associated domain-containing protein [Bacillota bacterium]